MANNTQISNLLKPPHHKPHPGRNHNHTGHAVKPPAHSVADTIHHLPHQNQCRRRADAEEHHHQGTMQHSGKGVMSLHGGACGGEEGGVGGYSSEVVEQVVKHSRPGLADGDDGNHRPGVLMQWPNPPASPERSMARRGGLLMGFSFLLARRHRRAFGILALRGRRTGRF